MKPETVTLSARIPVDLAAKFAEICRANCFNKSAIMTKIVEQYVKQVEGGK